MITDLIILPPNIPDGLHIMQTAPRPDGKHLPGNSILIPTPTILIPHRPLDKSLYVSVERIRHILFWSESLDVLDLHLFDDLQSVETNGVQGTESRAIHSWPSGTSVHDVIREGGDSCPKIAFWSVAEVVLQADAIATNDWIVGVVRDVETGGADDGINHFLNPILTYNSFIRHFSHTRKVHINIRLLDCLHVRVSWRDSSASHGELGREALE